MDDNRKVRFATTPNETTSQNLPSEPTKSKMKRGSLNPLEDLVQCALCMDRLTEPKMLTCQHTFCLNCLQNQLPQGKNEIKCPSCEQLTSLEDGTTLELLPENLYIESILKLLCGNSSPHTPTKMKPEMSCIKCQTLCQFSEHTCSHCKQIFCGICWSIHIAELTQKLDALHEHLNESLSRIEHRVDAFQDRCSQLDENIRATTEIRIKEMKLREMNCLEQAAKIKDKHLMSAEELRTQIKKLQSSIDTEKFESIADDIEKISYFMTLHRNSVLLLDELSRWGDSRTIFDPKSFKIEFETDAILDAEADDGIAPTGQSSNIGNPLDNAESLSTYYKTRSFTPKLTWNKCLRPAGVTIAPWDNNCLYIAGSDSRCVYAINKQKGKLLQRISSPLMLNPTGIAISHSREEIFVSDKWKHCIHVFSKEGKLLKSLGKKGSSKAQLRSPEGIAILKDRLYICDTGNDRIQVLNVTNDIFQFTFGITGSEQSITETGFVIDLKYTELNMPTGIAVTDDKIIVVDNGNRRIKTYSLAGDKTSEFGSLGKSKGQFRSPEVVAVDPLGFVFVGDSGNARVQIFTPNGTLVRVFGNKGKLAWVSGIHVTQQLDVIVTDCKNHTVNVF